MSKRNFMVFGLQESGKTTFAAALWHLVDSKELKTSLIKGAHTGDFHYLEKIAQLWCDGWQVERTKSEDIETARLNLKHHSSKAQITLEFTDLAGEHFEKAFATRLCDPSLIEIVNHAEGMLLFVSARRKIDDVTILDAFGGLDEEGNEAVPDASGQLISQDESDEDQRTGIAGGRTGVLTASSPIEESEEAPWDPEKTPMQVQLVDLLQAFRVKPFAAAPMKVAVVISAWDLSDGSEPDVWFAKRFPLLNQYLRGQLGALDLRIYGVSAQGGELSRKGEKPTNDRDKLMSIVPASERIIIAGTDVAPHDITRPVYWLSGLGESN